MVKSLVRSGSKRNVRKNRKNFMDVLVMIELMTNPLSGYDVILLIHKKFNLLVISGTVYSLLSSLERDGVIEGKLNDRKRVYVLTEKGEKPSMLF